MKGSSYNSRRLDGFKEIVFGARRWPTSSQSRRWQPSCHRTSAQCSRASQLRSATMSTCTHGTSIFLSMPSSEKLGNIQACPSYGSTCLVWSSNAIKLNEKLLTSSSWMVRRMHLPFSSFRSGT